jgi:hypothetical protein
VNVEDRDGEFLNFLSLSRGVSFPISLAKLPFYLTVCEFLENDELLRILLDHKDLSIETVAERLVVLRTTKAHCEPEIAFAASHFSELSPSAVSSIATDFSLISAILSNESLIVQDEDSLIFLICSLGRSHSTFLSLFENVRLEYASDSGIHAFIELMSESFECLSLCIWERVCERLLLPVKATSPNPHIRLTPVTTPSGIIEMLTKQCGRNVCDAGLISVTAAHTRLDLYGEEWNGRSPKVIFDLGTQLGWYDQNRDLSWLIIDFQSRRVHVTSYSITFGYDIVSLHVIPNDGSWKVRMIRTHGE